MRLFLIILGEGGVLVDAQVDDLEDRLVAHEAFVDLFLLPRLLAVRQDVLPDLAVTQLAQSVHEFTEPLTGHEQLLEVLVSALCPLRLVGRRVGTRLLATLQRVATSPPLSL